MDICTVSQFENLIMNKANRADSCSPHVRSGWSSVPYVVAKR